MGNTATDFRVDRFSHSWGDPQPVQATVKRVARRRLDEVPHQRRPGEDRGDAASGGAASATARTRGVYYHRSAAWSPGPSRVTSVARLVHAEDGKTNSPASTTGPGGERATAVLIMADENYTGPTPDQDPSGPNYLTYYTDALDEAGMSTTTSTTSSAQRHQSPDWLGVLSHYKAVIWYTGDDYLSRLPGQPGGTGTARFDVERRSTRATTSTRAASCSHGPERRPAVRGGQRVPQLRVPGRRRAAERAAKLRAAVLQRARDRTATPEFDQDDPDASPTAASPTTTTSSSTTWGRTSALRRRTRRRRGRQPARSWAGDGPLGGLTWSSTSTGANNQANSATFVVTSVDPGSGALSRRSRTRAARPPGCVRARRRSTRTAARKYVAAGADSRVVQAVAARRSTCTGATAPRADFKTRLTSRTSGTSWSSRCESTSRRSEHGRVDHAARGGHGRRRAGHRA